MLIPENQLALSDRDSALPTPEVLALTNINTKLKPIAVVSH
jgi:hypothetical protein